ncbi:hypothetical protein G7085_04930 [Tessaracoccus sp. HDW20]|uniref:hypothetical protein n=1 Tax=Tessaracoccus coleopterorum TaxID=2714950 RepID=UPI0018D4C285|nr:hypothetical protein [Tessaracoccus coleopterorum]NHB84187.1 hypothetical protein [Tessaracoccus coleopterorum]
MGGPREATELIRAGQPEPLASLLAPAQFLGRQPVTVAWPTQEGSPYYGVEASILLDPDLPAHTGLIDGAWPVVGADDAPFQVALTASFAERAELRVGDEITDTFVVAAIFKPLDGDDTRWEHNPYGRAYSEASSADRGLQLLGASSSPRSSRPATRRSASRIPSPTTSTSGSTRRRSRRGASTSPPWARS